MALHSVINDELAGLNDKDRAVVIGNLQKLVHNAKVNNDFVLLNNLATNEQFAKYALMAAKHGANEEPPEKPGWLKRVAGKLGKGLLTGGILFGTVLGINKLAESSETVSNLIGERNPDQSLQQAASFAAIGGGITTVMGVVMGDPGKDAEYQVVRNIWRQMHGQTITVGNVPVNQLDAGCANHNCVGEVAAHAALPHHGAAGAHHAMGI